MIMKMNEVTPAMLLAEVEKLQSEFPDAVYKPNSDNWNGPSHGYTVGSAGNGVGCIVGQAWQRLGVSVEEIESVEKTVAESADTTAVGAMLEYLGFNMDSSSVRALGAIQTRQDGNIQWRYCR